MRETTLGQDLNLVWEPLILNPLTPGGDKEIRNLMSLDGIWVHDEYRNQLGELLKCTHPKKKLKGAELQEEIDKYLDYQDTYFFGNWVYYPWSRRLIHVLPEEEFIKTRTSPNVPKITLEEQALLAGKKVGVVGLSVGQSVSLALSMERLCGELRIADFDTLELPNLNRIRNGLHHLGMLKTVIVAREIKEIDPYFPIRCFHEGLTLDNMDSFFHEGGDLDLVVDECDSVDIKIELRKKAKMMRIPVVMDMSDRGTLDIERFDLEPARPIMHGWLEHLDTSNVNGLSNEEKVPYMMPIFGIDTISKRLKASMVEISQSIHTWPQLATSVAMGGAMAADTVRRIFLDQFRDSGRYFVDLDLLVGKNTNSHREPTPRTYHFPPLTPEVLQQEVNEWLMQNPVRGELEDADVEETIRWASTAPSAGNNQAWKWYYHQGLLFLFHDKNLSWSWTDLHDNLALIGLGAAMECTRLALQKTGYSSQVYPVTENDRLLCAVFTPVKNQPEPENLVSALGLRHTNRKKGQTEKPGEDVVATLKEVIRLPEVQLTLFTEEAQKRDWAYIIARAEKMRIMDPQGHYEFFEKEIRWSIREAEETKDGLDLRTMELRAQDKTGMEVFRDPEVLKLLRKWKGGEAFAQLTYDNILATGGIGLVCVPDDNREWLLKGGSEVFRVWTRANQLGWSLQPVSAPLFFYNRSKRENHELSEEMLKEIQEYSENLLKLSPTLNKVKGLFLFRLSRAEAPSELALRKGTLDLLIKG